MCGKCGGGNTLETLPVWGCPKCGKVFCAKCCGARVVHAENFGGGIAMQQTDLSTARCPFCDKSARRWWEFWK